jgi:hypothetical protein
VAKQQQRRWLARFVVGQALKAREARFSSPLAAVVWVGEAQAKAGVRGSHWQRSEAGGLFSVGCEGVCWHASVHKLP